MHVNGLTLLRIERLGNRLWVLLDPFTVLINNEEITVPRGFVTDGASCPRILWWLCAPVAGPFGEGAVIHDFIYNDPNVNISRLGGDNILYAMGRCRKANIIRALAVKSGVNMFGIFSFQTGKSKLTKKACYNLLYASRRVRQLQLQGET